MATIPIEIIPIEIIPRGEISMEINFGDLFQKSSPWNNSESEDLLDKKSINE